MGRAVDQCIEHILGTSAHLFCGAAESQGPSQSDSFSSESVQASLPADSSPLRSTIGPGNSSNSVFSNLAPWERTGQVDFESSWKNMNAEALPSLLDFPQLHLPG